jgi:phosphoribosyl 1,2-cyclic phosphodiesterase
VKVTLWGTRGTLPAMGPETARYGGNTASVEVRGSNGTLLVLDAGTGIRRLGMSLKPGLQRVDILLSHLHLDHVQGLGVFGPLFQPETEVCIWGPPSLTSDLRSRLSRYLSPPLFPVRIRDLPCQIALNDAPLKFTVGEFEVESALVLHPGPTLGYRIREGRACIAYIPDHEPALGMRQFPGDPEWTSGYDIAAGVDLLIHDSQYTDAEYGQRIGWGHSSLPQAVALARSAGARRLVMFHHDPSHDDALLDSMAGEAREAAPDGPEIDVGSEGASYDLPA